jgi:hypothetical protein
VLSPAVVAVVAVVVVVVAAAAHVHPREGVVAKAASYENVRVQQ